MGFNFPNSPAVNDTFPNPAQAGLPVWKWNGVAWVTVSSGGAGGAVYVSDSAPVGAADNSLWWRSDLGILYVRYNDGDSTQWVVANPTADTSGYVAVVLQAFTAAQQAQARVNIYASPFDAMSYSGMQVNGSCDVSQENGTTAIAVSGGAKYIADSWRIGSIGAQVLYGQQGSNTGPAGIPSFMYMGVTTASASPAAADYAIISHPIEGYRIMRLAWGTASAQPITFSFWALANKPGTFTGAIQNSDSSRCYPYTYTINNGSVFEYKTITVPGCTDGIWNASNGVGMRICFAAMCGTTNMGTPNAWGTANVVAATGQINGVATTADRLAITGLTVLPGVEAPSAARSSLIMRPFDQELQTCGRYYQQVGAGWAGGFDIATRCALAGRFVPIMRIAPALSLIAGVSVTVRSANTTATAASPTLAQPYITADGGAVVLDGFSAQAVNAYAVCVTSSGAQWLKADARL